MTEFNPDSEIEPEEEVAEEAPEQTSNRTFILVALGLGGLFVIGLICIALFAFVVLPSRNQDRQATSVAVLTQNALVQTQAVLTANPATTTPLPTEPLLPTDTPVPPLPSDTPVIAIVGPTDTPGPTNTLGPSPTASRTPTRVGVRLAVGLGPSVLVGPGVSVGPTIAITGVSLGRGGTGVSVGRSGSVGSGVVVAGLAVSTAWV